MPDAAEIFVDEGSGTLATQALHDFRNGVAVSDDQYRTRFLLDGGDEPGGVTRVIKLGDQLQARRERFGRLASAFRIAHVDHVRRICA
jgi:hypothetical protein